LFLCAPLTINMQPSLFFVFVSSVDGERRVVTLLRLYKIGGYDIGGDDPAAAASGGQRARALITAVVSALHAIVTGVVPGVRARIADACADERLNRVLRTVLGAAWHGDVLMGSTPPALASRLLTTLLLHSKKQANKERRNSDAGGDAVVVDDSRIASRCVKRVFFLPYEHFFCLFMCYACSVLCVLTYSSTTRALQTVTWQRAGARCAAA
jgi:hypothetical protein